MFDKDNPLYIVPASLQESALNYICNNLETICKSVHIVKPSSNQCSPVLKFKDEQTFIPSEISEQLLAKLSEQRRLDDLVLSLFSSEATRLKQVKIKDASKLSIKGLRTLRGHKIQELEAVALSKSTITDLISCLGDWTLNNVRVLNVAYSTFMDTNKFCIVVALSKLKNLQMLNVSRTEFSTSSLELVVTDLPVLENLNFSCTNVTDISPLIKCKHRLKSLSMCGVKVPAEENDRMINILADLNNLVHLDVSDDEDFEPLDASTMDNSFVRLDLPKLINKNKILPHLQSLDISGSYIMKPSDLIQFLDDHKLRFLGLVMNDLSGEILFTDRLDESHGGSALLDSDSAMKNKYAVRTTTLEAYIKTKYCDTVISGFGNEDQILEVLRRYLDRPSYITKALHFLFRMSNNLSNNADEVQMDSSVPRVDIIQLVLRCAHEYPKTFLIQMAATACLYNLSKTELSTQLHPRILSQIVEVDMNAMENFPQHRQLQKNALLTIYSLRILQQVEFDKYRLTRLVLDCLCAWGDPYMIRMSVAICSVLAAKITTQETSELGSKIKYMCKLLSIVHERTQDSMVDDTLKLTLSALWNLTDDSPQPCQVFLSENGMNLYLDVLITFAGELAVETKVLGLFNNIAEVNHLRQHLMDKTFINHLSVLLQSRNIEVSYFAAGIVAHLVSDEDISWKSCDITQTQMSAELWRIVIGWKTPSDEMVAYRSFKPFFPLLAVGQHKSVQLWAAWAVHHVTSKNATKYCQMLSQQQVHQVLLNLVRSADTDITIANICEQILQIIVESGFLSQQETMRGREVFASF